MIPFLIFYCTFSLLFLLGNKVVRGEDAPFWYLILAPIILPIILGAAFSILVNK